MGGRARARLRNTYYHERLLGLLRFLIPENRRVLDLGCGGGDILERLRPSVGVGVDSDPAMVTAARERHPGLQFHVDDIERLSVPAEQLDFIVLCNVVGFLDDIQRALLQLQRYATPSTRIVIVHYNYLWEPALKLAERLGLKVREPYLNWLSLADLQNLLQMTGFEVIQRRQDLLLPLRVPLLSELLNRYAARLPVLWRLCLVETIVARQAPGNGPPQHHSCTVIVPARNERGTIEQIAKRIPPMGSHTEILFIEGHSRDGTFEEMLRVQTAYADRDIQILRQDGEGKADAVRKGMEAAQGDIVMILDADLTVRPEDLPKFFDAVASGRGELAIGNRLVYQRQEESMRILNLLGNKLFSLLFTFVLGQRIKDTLCGTKALAREHYRRIAEHRALLGRNDPFGDFELLFGASRENLRILEIPVRYYARQYGTTQIRRFRHGLLLLRMVWTALRAIKFASR